MPGNRLVHVCWNVGVVVYFNLTPDTVQVNLISTVDVLNTITKICALFMQKSLNQNGISRFPDLSSPRGGM